MTEINIGFYQTPFSNESIQIPLLKELNSIRKGVYSEIINEARFYYLNDRNKYAFLKRKLPAVTFSGVFGESRKLQFLKNYTHLIVLDVDNLTKEAIREKKKLIFDDAHTFSTWISPSGCGLKILIGNSSTKELHKFAFDSIVRYYHEKYNVDIDLSGSDITRLCFSSFDESLLVKDELIMFDFNDSEKVNENRVKDLSPGEKQKNKYSDKEMISKIIEYLSTRELSITENYDSWYRVALAIANTFTLDLGIKYFLNLCRIDGINHDEEKCIGLLEYCYRNRRIGQINFSTIVYLAKQKGFLAKEMTNPAGRK
jgi:hypothetical protein